MPNAIWGYRSAYTNASQRVKPHSMNGRRDHQRRLVRRTARVEENSRRVFDRVTMTVTTGPLT